MLKCMFFVVVVVIVVVVLLLTVETRCWMVDRVLISATIDLTLALSNVSAFQLYDAYG